MDNQRLLQYSLYGLGLVLAFVLWRFLSSVTDLILLLRHMPQVEVPIFGDLNNLYAILALVAAGGTAEYVRRNEMSSKFGLEVVSELRKVSWPNWGEVKGTTLVVLGVTFTVSLILFVFDKIYGGLIGLLFGLA